MAKMSGGCLCGAVRYEGETEPLFMGNCHCLDCRKVSPGGHSSVVAVPAAAISVTGDVSKYEINGDSGATVARHFCPKCGSQVYNTNDGATMAGMIVLQASTLDDPEMFKPAMAIYASRALSWDQPPEGLAQFPQNPQMGG